jgi:hypothetical protein
MPRLLDTLKMLFHGMPDLVQFPCRETVIHGKRQRFDPELAGIALTLNVHVHGLVAIETEEEQPVRSWNSLDPWHSSIL